MEEKMRSKRLNDIVTNINEYMGCGVFALGVIKAVIITMSIIQMGTTIAAVFNNSSVGIYNFSNIALIIGFTEIILGGFSLMMIILNINYKGGVVLGYLMVLGAIIMELLLPSIFFVYIECGIYMKAGSLIRKKNSNENRKYI